MTADELRQHLDKVRPSRDGKGYTARCPAHDDEHASLSVRDDHGTLLVKCHKGCTFDEILAKVPPNPFAPSPAGVTIEQTLTQEARYPYKAADGRLLSHVIRYRPKAFRQRAASGAWSMEGVARVLYRLPEELAAAPGAPVVVVEGEKDADRLGGMGFLATTNAGGAGKWDSAYAEHLRGRTVVLIPDNDDAGRQHAETVARSLPGQDVRLLELPGLAPKGDASDWLDAGHDAAELQALIAAAPRYRPGAALGIDAADLLAADIPPLRMIVPDLLPEGTTILAAPPKIGKSCLVYQVAVEVAIGGELFGRRVESGSCLYLALEDGQRRGQDRLRAALAGRTMPRGRLEVRWGARRIGQGLEEDIRAWLDDHPDAALVAIDTLQRVRPRSTGQRNAYEVDVEDLARLQDLFRDRRTALLIVHHSRKEAGDDFLASVSGTYGITGSADTTVVIRRKRLEAFGTVVASGRDIPEVELSVRFDDMLWHPAPEALSQASFERTEVYSVIQTEGPIFPAAIAERLGLGRTSVQNMVAKLVDGGAVMRTTRGYAVSGPTLLSLPDDSDDYGSHESHRGPARAHAREDLNGPAPALGSSQGQTWQDEFTAIFEARES